jgi:hypothetical protein
MKNTVWLTVVGPVVTFLVLTLAGCAGQPVEEEGFYSYLPWESHRHNQHFLTLYPSYPPVFFDRYLTWKDYDGKNGRAEQAMFIWQGEEMGRGKDGLKNVVSKIAELPPGSRILVYPDYDVHAIWDGPASVGRSCPLWHWEFGPEVDLRNIAVKRKLILLFSQRDHNGELCPGVEEQLRLLKEVYGFTLPEYKR